MNVSEEFNGMSILLSALRICLMLSRLVILSTKMKSMNFSCYTTQKMKCYIKLTGIVICGLDVFLT